MGCPSQEVSLYDVSVRYKTNDILLLKINIGQLETKILFWTTVNPKAARGFLYSLRKWAHIALLPSTKVFSQLATKLLDMASVFYFPCFYCAAHKFNLLFYSVEVKKRLREWRFLSYKASCSQNFLRYIGTHDDTDDRSIHFLEMNAACKHKHETFKWQSFIHQKYSIFCYVLIC